MSSRLDGSPIDRGTAAVSARRRYEGLHERREQRARDRFGRLSSVYLSLSSDPQSTRAWASGSSGERRLGAFLDRLDDGASVIVLHDRRIPGSRANVDHVAITTGGIFVIDAKNYAGKVQRIDKGGWFSVDLRLYVARRDCTRLVGAMANQVAVVRNALGEPLMGELVPTITPVLCFVDAEWSLFARPFKINGVWVEWAKSLGDRLQTPGPLAPEHVRRLARKVADSLPPA
jgi:hypothetical protein